ncbi:MAG: LPS assembly protein LptD [Alphaproteobacteria bacterium]|nr:LPS assembly protein LptD [Alphaproteobacteria bacterium]
MNEVLSRLLKAQSTAALWVVLLCAPSTLQAQTPPSPKSARPLAALPYVAADYMSMNNRDNIVRAIGHVEVAVNDKRLRADELTYNKLTGVVTAHGQVAIKDASGIVLFSDVVELTSDLRDGFIDKAALLFPDDSRFIAHDVQRYGGRYLIAARGIYSSCAPCETDPDRPLMWQMKGRRITHDSEKKDVIYRDATLEILGVPVFYAPYFSHPDPTVKRRQGFLSPSGALDNTLGVVLRTPYYFDMAPSTDLILTPTFSTKDKLQLMANWRYRFNFGEMNWNVSGTQAQFINEHGVDRGQRFRGHINGTTRFDVTENWRMGSNISLTTDKGYLPRYDISSEDVLINRLYAENFQGRNYGVVNGFYFQDLRPGAQLAEPTVLPEIRYTALGEPGQTLGGRWSLGSALLVTTRQRNVPAHEQGPDTRRLSLDGGWERQFILPAGFLTTLSGFTRADIYWADHVPDPNQPLGAGFSNITKIRPFAQADVTVRNPLGRRGQGYQQVIEPIAMLSLAPNVSHNTTLPNEDSFGVEFDETNLFASSRFSGVDRLEGGARVAYGLRHAVMADNGWQIDMIGGQIFRLRRDDNFAEGTGLNERFSDIVGRVNFLLSPWLTLNYGFRMDHGRFSFARQGLYAAGGNDLFRPFVNFLYAKQTNSLTQQAETVEEATFGFSSKFARFWNFAARHTHAFKPTQGPRATSISLTYQDECFTTGITLREDNTSRLDVKTGRSILFHLYLKNIGGLTTQ